MDPYKILPSSKPLPTWVYQMLNRVHQDLGHGAYLDWAVKNAVPAKVRDNICYNVQCYQRNNSR